MNTIITIDQLAGPMPCFKPELRQAIREKQKTQTRRIMKIQKFDEVERYETHPDGSYRAIVWSHGESKSIRCPYGKVGDIRYLREPMTLGGLGRTHYFDDSECVWADGHSVDWRWQRSTLPQIHMPKACARTFCRTTAIRVERLQDISDADIKAEGLDLKYGCPYRVQWIELWDSINADRGYNWSSNPWVWVISFEIIPNATHLAHTLNQQEGR